MTVSLLFSLSRSSYSLSAFIPPRLNCVSKSYARVCVCVCVYLCALTRKCKLINIVRAPFFYMYMYVCVYMYVACVSYLHVKCM